MTLLDRPPAATFQTVPVIETERLMLRAPRPDDAGALARLLNDRRIAENTARVPHPYGLADAEQFVGSVNKQDGEATFLITLPGDRIVGVCGVGRVFESDPEIGYSIGTLYWGQGYATEAARAVIDHAFASLCHDKLVGGARVSNPASRRVLEKCGFEWTGVALIRVRALRTSVPCDRFRLERAQWAALKNRAAARRVA